MLRMSRCAVGLVRELNFSSRRGFRESLRAFAPFLTAAANSQLDWRDLKSLYERARELDEQGIEGDFVECGVYRGGSAALLGYALRRSVMLRQLWLFDSFKGLPAPTSLDGPYGPAYEGALVGDARRVEHLLRKVRAPAEHVTIVPGWFHETLVSTPIQRVALLHIDADFYESIKLCLERFYDALEPGGVVILDDYHAWPGCKAAVEDFARARSVQIHLASDGGAPPYFHKVRRSQ